MANKARYYGIATKEQQDLKKRVQSGGGYINPEELTQWSIYSAMARVSGIDNMSAQRAARRIKEVIENAGFKGSISAFGTVISDGTHTYTLTKTKSGGIQIAKETHENRKREK